MLSDDTSDHNENWQTSEPLGKQQQKQRDKSRRKKKHFSIQVKFLMHRQYAASAIQVINTYINGKTNKEHESHVCLVYDCSLMGA